MSYRIVWNFVSLLAMLLLLYSGHNNKNVQCEPRGNIFTAIAHMEPLIDIEERLIDLAREYIKQERRKLDGLKQFAQSVREAMELSKDEPLKYLGNPVNSYLIIKRFTSGWRELASRLEVDDTKIEEMKTVLKANEDYMPTHERDLLGATNSIFRLQDTYNITAGEISDGNIKGVSRSVYQFTAEDCKNIAEHAHASGRYVRMKEWAIEAEKILIDPNLSHRVGNVTKLAIDELLGWTHYLSNDMQEALRYTKLVLEKDPQNSLALKNKAIFEWYVHNNEKSDEPEASWMDAAKHVLNRFVQMDYVQACRNTNPVMLKVKDPSSLVCYYTRSGPTLLLKPLKTMRVHDNPEVLVLHEVITEAESEKLKKLATPYLRQAQVVNPENTNEIIEADYRIAKTMFLLEIFPEAKRISKKLNQRFEDITGLSMETAEELQLNNYGLGGQYEFHIDHGPEGSSLALHPNGNRLATILCYLSDIERGGETVFTKLGLSIPPRKGDVVFWYNLHLNGNGNPNTEHASCPVVSGSKWVANKWIHQHGNEFRRKCSLNKDE